MQRALIATILLAMLACPAVSDQLILRDGRTFTGVVSISGDVVEIELDYGTLKFARDEVLQVHFKDTPRIELEKKLSRVRPDDAEGVFAIAQWAKVNGLSDQTDRLYRQVLRFHPDHAPTRQELAHLKLDGKWRDPQSALELARSKLEAGEYEPLINEILPAMRQSTTGREEYPAVLALLGETYIRARRFARALDVYRELATTAGEPEATRCAAIAEILADNPDGMYLITEPYPARAMLTERTSRTLEPGPASLSDPLVLHAALRDRAVEHVAAGRELLAEARKSETTETAAPGAARGKYYQASQAFDRADALVPGIARSYRIEIARRQIAAIRRTADGEAKKFDAAMEKLGKQDVSAVAYRKAVRRMLRNLTSVRGELESILEVAEPYPEELILEIQWARADLEKIDSMRSVLAAELDG